MSNYLIANFDRKEYLRPEQFGEAPDLKSVIESYDGILFGLAVLLSDGNNRGGGDLRSDAPIIGTWAGSRIAVINETVTDAALSEPGMQEVPLQQQMLALGRDVSAEILAVIAEAEGEYTALSGLNPLLTMALPHQRSLGLAAMKVLGTASARKQPLASIESFMEVLGAGLAWSPYAAKIRLQQGLLKTAQAFGHSARYDMVGFKWTQPKGKVPAGVVFTLRDLATQEQQAFSFKFGSGGTSAEAVFHELFPGLVFERVPTLSDSVSSPEVAKLLSMIPNLEV